MAHSREDEPSLDAKLHLRQRLFQAIHGKDEAALKRILKESPGDLVELALDAIQDETSHVFSQNWPVTPLSLAIQQGEANIVRLLVERCAPRSFKDAIQFERAQHGNYFTSHQPPKFGVAWDFTVKNPILTSMDATSVSLCALMRTRGHGQTIFNIISSHNFSLEDAHRCDLGRALWFWASCQNFPLVVQAFIDAGFPIDLLASPTSFPSHFHHDPRGPVLETTALWNAAWNGADEAVRVLLENGATMISNISTGDQKANIETQDNSRLVGLDALLAASQGLANERWWDAFDTVENPTTNNYALVVKHLLQHGANPEPKPTEQYHGTRRAFRRQSPSLPPVLEFAALAVTPAVRDFIKAGADVHITCDKGKSLLHYAIDSQSMELVSEVVKYNALINSKDSYGYTPAHSCVLDGTVEMLKLLIKNGADINAQTRLGIPVLLMAVSVGKGEMIETLLQNGADPNQSFTPPSNFKAKLDFGHPTMTDHFVACSPLLAALRRFAKFEHSKEMEATLGHSPDMAAQRALEVLLKYKVDLEAPSCIASRVFSRNRYGREQPTSSWVFEWVYPQNYATKAIFGHVKDPHMLGAFSIGKKLKKLTDVFAELYDDKKMPRSVLDVWMSNMCVSKALPALQSEYSDFGWLPLETLHHLLNLGASPHMRGSQGRTPLHVICMPPPHGAGYGWGNGIDQINGAIRRLISLGAEIDAQDNLGRTPLHYAVIYYPLITPTLLDAGADPCIQDINSLNPLRYALQFIGFRPGNSMRLLECMDDPNEFNKALLFNAASCPVETPEVDKILDQIFIRIESHEQPIFWSFDANGNTAFHIASMAKTWRERPINVLCGRPQLWPAFCMQDRLGRTPLMLSTFQGSARVATVLRGIAMAIEGNRVKQIRLTEEGPINASHLMSSKLGFSQVLSDPRLKSFYANLEAGKDPIELAQQGPLDQEMLRVSERKNPPLQDTWGSGDESPRSREISSNEESSGSDDEQLPETQSLVRQSLGQMIRASSQLVEDGWESWSDNESIYGNPKTKKTSRKSQTYSAPAEARAKCLNMRDVHGWTALHYAANLGDHEMVRILLAEPGLDVGKETGDADVPSTLNLAERSGNSECVRLISDALEARRGWECATESREEVEKSKEMEWTKRIDVRMAVLVAAIIWIYIRSMGKDINGDG